jgi:hypothetical protein
MLVEWSDEDSTQHYAMLPDGLLPSLAIGNPLKTI